MSGQIFPDCLKVTLDDLKVMLDDLKVMLDDLKVMLDDLKVMLDDLKVMLDDLSTASSHYCCTISREQPSLLQVNILLQHAVACSFFSHQSTCSLFIHQDRRFCVKQSLLVMVG